MKFVLISPKNRTSWNFRGDLVKTIIAKGYEVIVTGPNSFGIDKINDLGARFELIPLNKTGLNPLSDMSYTLSLYKLLRRERPEVILAYTIKPVIYGALAARLAGVKNINSMITGAGYLFAAKTFRAKLVSLLVRLMYRVGFACAVRVIFQNRDDIADFVGAGLLKRDKCRLVNGSGVNMEKFRPAPFPERVTFFMLSRILYCKGVREYLQAARQVKNRHPEVRFMLLGEIENNPDSLPMSELSSYIDDGVVDSYGETDDVASYYRHCSVYVLPSYREGIPRTVLEAMAMGRPVITTDAPGCRETVRDGENGFLVPVRDSAALAAKMRWFLEHPERIAPMGRASHAICREKFAVGLVNRTMLEQMSIQ